MRLLSWNIQWGRDASGVVDLGRTLDEARRIVDFDVLALQEVTRGFSSLPGGPSDDQFAELAAALPGFTVLEAIGADLPPLVPGGARRQFGNALATRLPVEQVIRHTLPWPADENTPSMQRVALEAVVRTPIEPLRIIVTHLEYYSLKQRVAQVDKLRRLQLEAAGHAAHPAPAENATGPFAGTARPVSAIVCGDFNSEFGSEAYQQFIAPLAGAPGFVDAWTTLHPGHTPPPTAGVYDVEQWSSGPIACDFVFITEDLTSRLQRCEIDGATRASDHQPIVLELR
ncbi:endonuclease [Trinickia symbiotica]|uniref:Endonuclease n=1 Tax=Trinickia symbiotica TaxID=863227 RepID=A0A2T3XMH0_9BURK|nr:endonuclease/exonuclease/phosphatase family protein [Trinickia symbiotica]PTB17705.1 endonuclease [Trinickia symbiotica]